MAIEVFQDEIDDLETVRLFFPTHLQAQQSSNLRRPFITDDDLPPSVNVADNSSMKIVHQPIVPVETAFEVYLSNHEQNS